MECLGSQFPCHVQFMYAIKFTLLSLDHVNYKTLSLHIVLPNINSKSNEYIILVARNSCKK